MNMLKIYILIFISLLLSEQKILAHDGDEGDYFGNSVELNDDWIIVGANKDEPNGLSSGSVYIYQKSGNEIINNFKIYPQDSEYNDFFGKSYIISPTENPAISNLSFKYIPFISAVSPPINLHFAISHP